MPRGPRRIALAFCLVFGALRLAKFGAPLTADEGFMLRAYAREPVAFIRSNYQVANNHVLHALLLHAIDALSPKRLIGSLAHPGPLQLPSIAASIALLPLVYGLAALLFSPPVALLSVLIVGISFWPLIYSHMLRAYSLSAFAVAGCAWLLAQACLRRRVRLLWLLPAALAATHYLVPSNAYFTAPLCLWALWRQRRSPDLRALAASLAAGAVLTLGLYAPILAPLLGGAGIERLGLPDSAAATGRRLAEYRTVLGPGWLGPFLLAGCAAALVRVKRRGRHASGAALALAVAVIPVLLTTLQGVVPPARTYLPALPFLALLASAGFWAAAWRLRGRLPMSGRRAWLAPAACVLALGSAQVRAFWSWNRGLDPRRALERAVSLTREWDDFAVIYTDFGDTVLGDVLVWDYYATAADLEPYYASASMQDLPYLIRGAYLVLARGPEEARAALARSRVDPLLIARLRRVGQAGATEFYALRLDAEAARDLRAALGAETAPPRRAALLSALAAYSIRNSYFDQAVRLMREAETLAPEDARVRYLAGTAHYLAYDDAAAEAEFRWVVARDSENVHAPFFLGDCLAAQGRFSEAERWFRWYLAARPAAAWVFKTRVQQALRALESGRGWPARSPSDESLEREALAAFKRGAYERAAVSLSRATRSGPSPRRIRTLALMRARMHEYAGAIRLARQLQATGHSEDKLLLAGLLRSKREFDEARRLVASVLAAEPANAEVRELAAKLERM